MFSIKNINVPIGYSFTIMGGADKGGVSRYQPGDVLGPQGARYYIAVAGLGSFFIEDIGPVASGWGVRINGTDTVWSYQGGGQASIDVSAEGEVVINGGSGSVKTSLITDMNQTGILSQKMLETIRYDPRLAYAWDKNPMLVLYSLGFPRTSMVNMEDDCCRQFVEVLQSIKFYKDGSQDQLAYDPEDATWWSCTLCKMFEAGVIAAVAVSLTGAIIAATAATGGAAPAAVLAAIQASASVAEIAIALGIGVGPVAKLALAAFAAGGVAVFVSEFIELLCQWGGYCASRDLDVAVA